MTEVTLTKVVVTMREHEYDYYRDLQDPAILGRSLLSVEFPDDNTVIMVITDEAVKELTGILACKYVSGIIESFSFRETTFKVMQ